MDDQVHYCKHPGVRLYSSVVYRDGGTVAGGYFECPKCGTRQPIIAQLAGDDPSERDCAHCQKTPIARPTPPKKDPNAAPGRAAPRGQSASTSGASS